MTVKLLVMDAAWDVHFTHHIILGSSPRSVVLAHDIQYNLPFLAERRAIGHKRL